MLDDARAVLIFGLGEATRLILTYWEDFTGGSSGLSLPIDPDLKLRLYWWGLGLVALVVVNVVWFALLLGLLAWVLG